MNNYLYILNILFKFNIKMLKELKKICVPVNKDIKSKTNLNQKTVDLIPEKIMEYKFNDNKNSSISCNLSTMNNSNPNNLSSGNFNKYNNKYSLKNDFKLNETFENEINNLFKKKSKKSISKKRKKLNYSMIENKSYKKLYFEKLKEEKNEELRKQSSEKKVYNLSIENKRKSLKKKLLRNSVKLTHSNSLILTNKNYFNNMEMIFSDIHKDCFENYKTKIKEKEIKKDELLNSILNIKKKIALYNNKIKYWNIENSKVVKEINKIKDKSERIKYSNYIINKDQKGIPNYEKELYYNIDQTVKMEKELIIERNNLETINNEIKKKKKCIFDLKKEIEKLKDSISFFKKHNENLKEKLKNYNDKENKLINTFSELYDIHE